MHQEVGMKKELIVSLTIVMASSLDCRGQVGGNIGHAQAGGKARAELNEQNKRVLTPQESPPSPTSMFVEANVLLNVKAEEYVAVFGVSQEGATLPECSRKMETTIKQFSDDLKAMGVGGDDLFVDFVAQNRIYG